LQFRKRHRRAFTHEVEHTVPATSGLGLVIKLPYKVEARWFLSIGRE
jgi:hypothetical protein